MTRSERTPPAPITGQGASSLLGHESSISDRGRRAAESAWRIEWPRLVAGLTRIFGDIDAAEDLAQDALLAALEQWPRDGVPPNPGAWLMVTARHRAVDRQRRDATFRRKLSVLGGELVIEDAEPPLPTRARSGGSGTLVTLADQDRSRWDRLLIRRGFAELGRAHALNHRQRRPPGRYALQAAIAAAHAMAATPQETDWRRIAGLYAVLAQRFPSPIVELNRAVAVAMCDGPRAGLALLEAIAGVDALSDYHLFHAVRGDLLARLGRDEEAAISFCQAADLTANIAEQDLLRDRASALR
jgi:predicted RNA polymerase sigma factor